MSEKLQIFTALVAVCSAICSVMTLGVLVVMSQQANKRADDVAEKAEEVKNTLQSTTNDLAKESTLQELKNNSLGK